MSVFSYAYPFTGVVSSDTLTACVLLPKRKDCAGDCIADPCCGWNHIHCTADLDYYIPVCIAEPLPDPECLPMNCRETDILYFIFEQPDDFNEWGVAPGTHGWTVVREGDWLAQVQVFDATDCTNDDPCDLSLDDIASEYYVGGGGTDNRTVQSIAIDPTLLPCKFRLKFSFNRASGEIFECFTPMEYSKEPCQQTVLLEGTYSNKDNKANTDCQGKYYGIPPYILGTNVFYYKNIMRFGGFAEQNGASVERRETDGFRGRDKTTNETILSNKLTAYLDAMPPYVFDKLAVILSGRRIYLNAAEVRFDGELTKNRQFGLMLEPTIDFISQPCLNEFECDGESTGL